MRRSLSWLVPALFPLCVGCGSPAGSSTHGGTGGGAMSTSGTGGMTSGTGGMVAGGIPGPGTGNQVDQDFTDVEPNNTPQQATPLGVAMMGDLNVWVGGNKIGGSSNPADYFVFRSGPKAGKFTFNMCFGPPVTGMTATLAKVVGGMEQAPPVGTWTSSGTCVTNTPMGTPIEATTDYLFGVTATGGVGSYSA